jgi:Ran GTPase-activating protein (RanGAP) involved in mRNA processing and transport
MQRLDLTDNSFGGEGSEVLASALAQYHSLREVSLRDCSLEFEGGRRIIEALAALDAPLCKVDLCGNELSSLCVEPLVGLLHSKPTIQYLGLDENELSSDGVKLLASELKVSTPS